MESISLGVRPARLIMIELEDVVGLNFATRASRLSYNSKGDGEGADLALLGKLVKRGPSHAKSLRMVFAYHRVIAPRYWWIEFSTYRHGVESSSGSTMHSMADRPFELTDFGDGIEEGTLRYLNAKLAEYKSGLISIDEVKGALPEAYLQERYIVASYQALRAIYSDRRQHRLRCWRRYCEWIEGLPHASTLITAGLEG